MQLEFWGAAQEVTGSCFLLRTGKHRILIDCGLIQGAYADEQRNRDPFPFSAAAIDAVILTHAHLDHSGRLPLLRKAGFRGPIFAQQATTDLARIMLRDAAYLNEKETEWANKKRQRKGLQRESPLYTRADVTATMRLFRSLPYEQPHDILPGVRVRLRDAGHILGSCIVELWLDENKRQRKIVFSGDLGHRGAPILRDPARIEDADLVVMESTYGDRLHRSWEATWQELAQVLASAREARGNILIPAFAVGRTQELLYQFTRHYHPWQLDPWTIFLDSPLAIEATQIYAHHAALYDSEAKQFLRQNGDPFFPPNTHYSKTAAQSMAINRVRSGALIIAGSGMCDGGRIKHHLKHNLWRDNCHLIIVGFQAQGTLGRRIVDGASHVRLWGETIKVAAHVHTIGGLSAHADQAGLLDWLLGFKNSPRVALVHGEPMALESLAAEVKARTGAAPTVPVHGQVIEI